MNIEEKLVDISKSISSDILGLDGVFLVKDSRVANYFGGNSVFVLDMYKSAKIDSKMISWLRSILGCYGCALVSWEFQQTDNTFVFSYTSSTYY